MGFSALWSPSKNISSEYLPKRRASGALAGGLLEYILLSVTPIRARLLDRLPYRE